MFRTNHDESRTSFDFDSSQRSLGMESSPAMNRSFNSTNSTTAGIALQSTASSSKAVLAALRALQDKIRRLESEKSQALDDAAQLRTQLKSLEIENDHARERDALHSQKLLQDARMAYEKVLSDKTEMENRIRTLDKQLQKVNGELQSITHENKELESAKRAGTEKLQQLENQVIEMELKLQESLQKEQELSSAMVWETRRHEEEIHSLKHRIESLTSEASISSLQRVERESKLVELDHLIGQLLGVNETLVNQLSQRTTITPSVSGKSESRGSKGLVTKKKRSSSAPRLHPNSDVPPPPPPNPPSHHATSTTSFTKMDKAHERKNTRTRSVSGGAGTGAGGLYDMHEMYVSLAKQITGKDLLSTHTTAGKKKRITSMKQRTLKGKTNNNNSMSDDQSYASSTADNLSRKSVGGGSPYPSSYHQHHHPPPPHPSSAPTSASELQSVIQSLEEEFNLLNRQYQQLLQPKMGSSSSSSSTLSQEDRSRELVSIIQRLHKKGEQLRALRNSPQKG